MWWIMCCPVWVCTEVVGYSPTCQSGRIMGLREHSAISRPTPETQTRNLFSLSVWKRITSTAGKWHTGVKVNIQDYIGKSSSTFIFQMWSTVYMLHLLNMCSCCYSGTNTGKCALYSPHFNRMNSSVMLTFPVKWGMRQEVLILIIRTKLEKPHRPQKKTTRRWKE